MPESVTFTVSLDDLHAQSLAQFLKRVGFSECRQNAIDDDEAYQMIYALDRVRVALNEVGYDPR